VASADLDGDGDLDLAIANYGSNDVTILMSSTTHAPDGTQCNSTGGCYWARSVAREVVYRPCP
jgi:hypothetical protein